MSAASTMARAMHHYMVKSSAGVFRARLVVPMCDWPSILDDYDTVDDSAGRTRLDDGVLVTELAGPRNTNRVLCVTAHTASVFVDVLHRLLCGLAGDSEVVATRLLVGREDFESATAGHGRGGIGTAVDELRRAAAVNISERFEQFHVYPLAGETALHIVGRPSAVVHCVCLVNEWLCETATAAAARLVAAGRRPSRREDATNRPASASRPNHLGWSVFAPLDDQYSSSSHTATATYWPAVDPRLATPAWGARLANQYSQLSPIETYSDFPSTNPGSVPPVRGARLADQFSPLSPTETNSDWPAVEPRPTTAVWRASERLPDQYSTQGPINTTTWPPVDPRLFTSTPIWSVLDNYVNRNQLSRLATASGTRPTTPIRPVSNRLIVSQQPSQLRVATDVTTTTVTNRLTTSVPSVSNRLVNQNPSSCLAATSGTRPTTPIRPVSNRLIVSQQPLQSRVTTDVTTTAVTNRLTTSVPSVSNRLVNQNPSSCLAATSGTRPTTPIRPVSNRLIVSQQPSQSRVATDVTTTAVTNRLTTSVPSVSNRLVNQNPSSCLAAATTTQTTNSTTTVFIELTLNQQPPSSRVTTNATATTNRHATPVPRVSVRLTVNRQPSPSNVTTVATTATTSTTVSTTNTTTSTSDQSSSESGDSSQTVPLPIMEAFWS